MSPEREKRNEEFERRLEKGNEMKSAGGDDSYYDCR